MRIKAGTCALFVLPLALAVAAQGGAASACQSGGGGRANLGAARGGESEMGQGEAKTAEAGLWGGPGVRLEVGERGAARVEFDCAHGTVEKLALGDDGGFAARGLFVKERGGPVREGEREEGERARYSGKVEGKTMTLRVVLEASGADLGPFTLTHGRGARLTKCL